MHIEWDKYRRDDNTIKLLEVWVDHCPLIDEKALSIREEKEAIKFFQGSEQYHPITSRQVASLIMIIADANLVYVRE